MQTFVTNQLVQVKKQRVLCLVKRCKPVRTVTSLGRLYKCGTDWLTRFIKPLPARPAVVALLCRCTDLHKAVTHFAFQVQQSLTSESSLSPIVSKDRDARAHTRTHPCRLSPQFLLSRQCTRTHDTLDLRMRARTFAPAHTPPACSFHWSLLSTLPSNQSHMFSRFLARNVGSVLQHCFQWYCSARARKKKQNLLIFLYLKTVKSSVFPLF